MKIELCDLCLNRIERIGGKCFRYKTEKFFNGKWQECDICYNCLEKLRKAVEDRKKGT